MICQDDEIILFIKQRNILTYFLVGQQRLKDFGYIINNVEEEDEEDEDSLSKLEDEVKCAPWHTTKAFLQAAKGRCILQLTGKPRDPAVKFTYFLFTKQYKHSL